MEKEPDIGSGRARAGSGVPKSPDPKHTREVIFALPSLQTHLKTEHLQAPTTPSITGKDFRSILSANSRRKMYLIRF